MIVKDLDSLELGFDIVIIGAGAAGCTLAANLSDNFKILIVDSKDFPRKKACSGILVSEAIDFFENNLDESVILKPSPLDIHYLDWDNSVQKFSKKGFLNTDRFVFDNYLFNPVRNKKNISFIKNTNFVEFTSTTDKLHKVVMLESNGLVKPIIAKYIVGCDGALSSIRRKIDSKNIKFYIGIQEFIKSDLLIDKAYFIFDNNITDFYSWVIPKKPYIEIGSLMDPSFSKERFALFKKKVGEKFNLFGDGIVNSAIVLRPSSLHDVCLGKDSVLLCGEAAGLISPSSAEGISYALRSAKCCADALNSGKDPLTEYSKNTKSILDRLSSKFEKSKALSDKNKRKKLFI